MVEELLDYHGTEYMDTLFCFDSFIFHSGEKKDTKEKKDVL